MVEDFGVLEYNNLVRPCNIKTLRKSHKTLKVLCRTLWKPRKLVFRLVRFEEALAPRCADVGLEKGRYDGRIPLYSPPLVRDF